MKLIINIPDEVYKDIQSKSTEIQVEGYMIENAILNGTLIPDNASNGDIIKAMFPNIITDEFASTIHATTKVVSNSVKGSISYDFWKDWWNALYER